MNARTIVIAGPEDLTCPSCGHGLSREPGSAANGWTLASCEMRTQGKRCGQKTLILGPDGNFAVVVPVTQAEFREISDQHLDAREVIDRLNLLGVSFMSVGPSAQPTKSRGREDQ